MKPDLTTRRGIDAEIMDLRSEIRGCDIALEKGEQWDCAGKDLRELIQECSDKIQELVEHREALAKPWEKPRPAVEASLTSFGVGI